MATYLSKLENPYPAKKRGSAVVRFGVIGFGYWGPNVVRNLSQLENADVLGVCDTNPVARKRLHKAHPQIAVASDPAHLISSPDVDAIAVITPVWTHYELAKAALENGKHVFVEKPLCVDEAELNRVAESYAASGRILSVGFNRRFSPFARECRDFFAGRHEPLSILYRVNAGRLPAGHWIYDPAQGHGRVIGEVCHFVDLVGFLASSPSDVIDSKPQSRKIAIVACSITQLKLWGATTDHALGCAGVSPVKA